MDKLHIYGAYVSLTILNRQVSLDFKELYIFSKIKTLAIEWTSRELSLLQQLAWFKEGGIQV